MQNCTKVLHIIVETLVLSAFIGNMYYTVKSKNIPTKLWIFTRIVAATAALSAAGNTFSPPKELNLINKEAEFWIWTVITEAVTLLYVFFAEEAPYPYPTLKPLVNTKEITASEVLPSEMVKNSIITVGRGIVRGVFFIIVCNIITVVTENSPKPINNMLWLINECNLDIILAWFILFLVTVFSEGDDSNGHRKKIKDTVTTRLKSLIPNISQPQTIKNKA